MQPLPIMAGGFQFYHGLSHPFTPTLATIVDDASSKDFDSKPLAIQLTSNTSMFCSPMVYEIKCHFIRFAGKISLFICFFDFSTALAS